MSWKRYARNEDQPEQWVFRPGCAPLCKLTKDVTAQGAWVASLLNLTSRAPRARRDARAGAEGL